MAKEDILNRIRDAYSSKTDIVFPMATMPPDITPDEIASEIQNLTGKDVRGAISQARNSGSNFRIPFSTLSSPALPKGEPNLGAGKATAIRGETGSEKAAGYAPAIGGAIGGLAGFASPVPGGAALGTGIGAGIGKYIEQKYRGAPDMASRAQEIGKEVSTQMLAGEAVPMGLQAGSVALKNFTGMTSRGIAKILSLAKGPKSSYESIARYLGSEGPKEAIAGAGETLSQMRAKDEFATIGKAVESDALENFNKLQTAMDNHRGMLGKAVERADNSLINRTKDVTFDMSKRADMYATKLNEAVGDARTALYSNVPELKKISDFVSNLKAAPYADMDSLLQFRRMLDEQINWKKMPMGEKVPDAVEDAMRFMRNDISSRIKAEAKKKGLGVYEKIYDKFSDFATEWSNTLRKAYGSVDKGDLAKTDTFQRFVNMFNRGGYRSEILKGTADRLSPADRHLVEKTLDSAAAYNILSEAGGPSSPMAGIYRKLILNPTTLNMVRGGRFVSGKTSKVLESKIAEIVGRGAATTTVSKKGE